MIGKLLFSALALFLLSTPSNDLVPQWSANLDIDIKVMLTHYIQNGYIVVDAKNLGLYSNVYGDDPHSLWGKVNATVVVHPNMLNSTVDIWDVTNGKCSYDGRYSDDKIPPLTIPSTARYMGTRTVDQYICDIWRLANPYADVSYSDIFIYNSNIQLIEALYTGGAANAWFYIRFTSHSNSTPDMKWFEKPLEC